MPKIALLTEMQLMTLDEEKILNRKEIQEALENLKCLKKDGFMNIPKLTWWVLNFEELSHYCDKNRHYGSCYEGMTCPCISNNPENRFNFLYPSLQEIIELHKYEEYFRQEMFVLENVREDYPALMQWLKKNEKLGTKDFFLFWIEWYEEDLETVKPFVLNEQSLDIKFKAGEWQNTINFLEAFNEFYYDKYNT